MKRVTLSRVSITAGSIFLLAAALLCGYNLWTAKRAEMISDEVGSLVQAAIEERISSSPWMSGTSESGKNADSDPENKNSDIGRSEYIPDYVLNPEMNMPTIAVDEVSYLGMISIPDLGLTLPVASVWSYGQLAMTPCRFSGSAYLDDLVIMAHNYRQHFGRLNQLRIGSEIQLSDADGNVFKYRVAEVEVLEPTEVGRMTASDYPLTLFTCTFSGLTRFTVRCEKTE